MFSKGKDHGWVEMLEGVERMTLAHGERTLLGAFRLAAGATIPMHQHSPDVEHGVEVMEDALVIEVFSPRREDYMP